MKNLVEHVARALVTNPEHVQVVEHARGSGLFIELTVAPDDIGKIIGRQGRTIAALRTLVAVAAELAGRKATLELRE